MEPDNLKPDTVPTQNIPIEAPEATQKAPESPPAEHHSHQLLKYFVYILVGGLIISALVAVIAALIGNMSGLVGKTIWTVVAVVIHSLAALGFISMSNSRQPNVGSTIVINTLFTLTVLSLITSMLSTWGILTDGEFIVRQYTVYFVAFVTSLIIYGLFQSAEQDRATRLSRNTAIGSSLALFVLLLPAIYGVNNLPDIYFRLLLAVSIVVGVSIVITVIFNWYYLSKQPKTVADRDAEKMPLTLGQFIGRFILGILIFWIGMTFVVAIIQTLSRSVGY